MFIQYLPWSFAEALRGSSVKHARKVQNWTEGRLFLPRTVGGSFSLGDDPRALREDLGLFCVSGVIEETKALSEVYSWLLLCLMPSVCLANRLAWITKSHLRVVITSLALCNRKGPGLLRRPYRVLKSTSDFKSLATPLLPLMPFHGFVDCGKSLAMHSAETVGLQTRSSLTISWVSFT